MPATCPTRTPSEPSLLADPHNSKLGRLVHSFSIPAGDTCPGKTPRCSRFCYADRGRFLTPWIIAALAARYAASLTEGFAQKMVLAILRAYVRVVRIHVAGDFYSAEYTRKWVAIVRRCPEVRFYAYTRSWRDPEILPVLRELAALPNMDLWFSEDRQTGDSPHVPGVRVAYLVVDPLDAILMPDHVDLAFRERIHRATVGGQVKRIGNALVCPHEQSDALAKTVTCSSCRLCFTSRLKSRRDKAV